MIRTIRSYPYRHFYKENGKVASYVIYPIGDGSVSIFDRDRPVLFLKRKDVCEREVSVRKELNKLFDKELSEVILRYLKKDLNCPINLVSFYLDLNGVSYEV